MNVEDCRAIVEAWDDHSGTRRDISRMIVESNSFTVMNEKQESLIKSMTGQVMKDRKGCINPKIVDEVFRQTLSGW